MGLTTRLLFAVVAVTCIVQMRAAPGLYSRNKQPTGSNVPTTITNNGVPSVTVVVNNDNNGVPAVTYTGNNDNSGVPAVTYIGSNDNIGVSAVSNTGYKYNSGVPVVTSIVDNKKNGALTVTSTVSNGNSGGPSVTSIADNKKNGAVTVTSTVNNGNNLHPLVTSTVGNKKQGGAVVTNTVNRNKNGNSQAQGTGSDNYIEVPANPYVGTSLTIGGPSSSFMDGSYNNNESPVQYPNPINQFPSLTYTADTGNKKPNRINIPIEWVDTPHDVVFGHTKTHVANSQVLGYTVNNSNRGDSKGRCVEDWKIKTYQFEDTYSFFCSNVVLQVINKGDLLIIGDVNTSPITLYSDDPSVIVEIKNGICIKNTYTSNEGKQKRSSQKMENDECFQVKGRIENEQSLNINNWNEWNNNFEGDMKQSLLPVIPGRMDYEMENNNVWDDWSTDFNQQMMQALPPVFPYHM